MHWLDLLVFFVLWIFINYILTKLLDVSTDPISSSIGFLIKLLFLFGYTIIYLLIFTVFDVNWSDLSFVPDFIIIGNTKINL